jgi:hypothetical protein
MSDKASQAKKIPPIVTLDKNQNNEKIVHNSKKVITHNDSFIVIIYFSYVDLIGSYL